MKKELDHKSLELQCEEKTSQGVTEKRSAQSSLWIRVTSLDSPVEAAR